MRVGIAADHKGFELKQKLIEALQRDKFAVVDYGAFSFNHDDDFTDFIIPMARHVSQNELDRGIAICGSGIGACIVANKIRNARAGIVHDIFSARQGVEDDNMNIVCLGAQLTDFSLALNLVQGFLNAKFKAATRFRRRMAKVRKIEETELSQ